MKKGIIAVTFLFAFTGINAQTDSSFVEINEDIFQKPDTNTIQWGKKKIIIISESEGEKSDTTKKSIKREQRYNHFAGVDLGVNGFLNAANSVDLNDEAKFMDLNYAKSISVAINFMEFYIPVWQEKIGISTGLGFEFNSYDFARDVTISSNQDTTLGLADDSKNIEKNRFKSTMLNLPLMLETNIGRDAKHSFHLAVGGMASYRIGSKTKQIFDQAGSEYKVKNRTDFNMNPFRFNAVARVGYGDFTLFASYSLTSLFEKDKGPELYPFTVGVSLVSF